MKILLLLSIAFVLGGCGDLPDSGDVQEQQMQRSFYGSGNPAANNPPPTGNQRPTEPIPGEQVPDR